MNKNWTSHSEVGKLISLFINRPETAFINQNRMDEQWEDLNYLSKPDFDIAIQEYSQFEQIIKETGTTVLYLDGEERVTIDSIYCRDSTIMTDHGAILCNMGKNQRGNEPQIVAKNMVLNEIKILAKIEFPGTIEGGDTAWIDSDTLAVGNGYRTNESGIEQMKTILNKIGVNVIRVDLPHFRGPNDVFHLMSIFSPVDHKKAVVYSPLMPVSFRNYLLDNEYALIEVPEQEYDSLGCNVLALSPSNVLMVKGNPITKERLLMAGCKVTEYQGNEISLKGGGGPTCLTRPLWREK